MSIILEYIKKLTDKLNSNQRYQTLHPQIMTHNLIVSLCYNNLKWLIKQGRYPSCSLSYDNQHWTINQTELPNLPYGLYSKKSFEKNEVVAVLHGTITNYPTSFSLSIYRHVYLSNPHTKLLIESTCYRTGKGNVRLQGVELISTAKIEKFDKITLEMLPKNSVSSQ